MHTIEYYLKKGIPLQYAEYYASGTKTIVSAYANDDFTVTISFNNGEKRKLDLKPIIDQGGVFEHFNTLEAFKRLYVDECHTICWDINPNVDSNTVYENKVDLSPEFCYVESVPC